MTIKITIHEICQECGERVASVVGQYIHYQPCKACEKPPGPPNPKLFRIDEVIFVSAGEICPLTQQLQKEINQLMDNLYANDYEPHRNPLVIAEEITDLVKEAEGANPKFLVPFIEDWQERNAQN